MRQTYVREHIRRDQNGNIIPVQEHERSLWDKLMGFGKNTDGLPKIQDMDDRDLLDQHRLIHSWHAQAVQGDNTQYSPIELERMHDAVAEEMQSRDMRHNSPLGDDNEDDD